jgi:hypothetical protein
VLRWLSFEEVVEATTEACAQEVIRIMVTKKGDQAEILTEFNVVLIAPLKTPKGDTTFHFCRITSGFAIHDDH